MAQIIDGKKIAEKIKDDIVKEVRQLPGRPSLAIILIGHRADSELYVSLKEEEAKKCGLDTHLYKFEESINEQEILNTIKFLNRDGMIDGILLQMPLPKRFDANKIVKTIDPQKEIDGFHPENLKKIRAGQSYLMPVLAAVVLEILKNINCELGGKTVALLAHSDIFMNGVGEILQQRGAKILPCGVNAHTLPQLRACSRQADILITAIGKKHCVNASFIKPDAVVIDIGIIRESGKTFGDVDFDSVKSKASFITPVPGGVGPITIACAFRNILNLHNAKLKMPARTADAARRSGKTQNDNEKN